MDLSKLKWELKNELLIEFALIFAVYWYALCALAATVYSFMKYDNVTAIIHSKTYFGMEKDACVPSKPMNGVCMGVVYSYKGKEYTGYIQLTHDKFKIGDNISVSVEKDNPDMINSGDKSPLKLSFWLLLSFLLAALSSIKLSLFSMRPKYFNSIFISNLVFGVVFVAVLVSTIKS